MTIIAIAVLVVIVAALVALIRRDSKCNPSRDWHVQDLRDGSTEADR